MKRRDFLLSAAGLLLPGIVVANDLQMHGSANYPYLDMGGSLPLAVHELEMGCHLRLLDLYAPTWCPHCTQAKKDVAELSKDFEVRIQTDSELFPKFINDQAAKSGWGYPLVHWETRSKSGRMAVWTGLEAFRKHDTKDNALAVTTPIKYPTRGGLWSFPGSGKTALINHLMSGRHAGKFSKKWLETLSLSSLSSLHSDDHEGRVKYQYITGSGAVPVKASAYCPTCPQQSRRVSLFGI